MVIIFSLALFSVTSQLLTNWARQWLVTFDPLKAEAVLFTLKKLDFLPQLVLIIFQLVLYLIVSIPDLCNLTYFVDNHKYLGITLSSTGQGHSHFENIVISATKLL